jgi:CRP/FNR family transcriptional regulator, cyclic AMP receptor protein
MTNAPATALTAATAVTPRRSLSPVLASGQSMADAFTAPLAQVPVLQGLSAAQLSEVAHKAERVMFRIGQTIIKAGAAGDGAYLIIVGEAERRDGADVSVVVNGSLVGEMAMLIETDYATTVVAKTAIRAIKITRAALYAQMERDPQVAEHFVDKIAARLRAFSAEVRRIEAGLDGDADPVGTPSAAINLDTRLLSHVG